METLLSLKLVLELTLFLFAEAHTCTNIIPASNTYGINLHNHDPTPAALDQMMNAGLTTYRIDGFDWINMEFSPNKYNLTGYNQVIPLFQTRGLRVITGIGHTPPPFYNGSIYSKSTQAGLIKMYAALSKQYSDVMWEFTNEPNDNVLWENNASGFTLLAKQICQAIHRNSASNECVGPSTAFISRKFKDFDWLQQTFEHGLLDHIDAILVHPYRADAPETAIPDFHMLRQLVDSYSPLDKTIQIYNGEWGYSNNPSGSPSITLEEQAILTARVFLVSHMISDGLSIWYDWMDGGNELMGLVHNDNTPKPSYYATKTLARMTNDTSFIVRIPTFQDGATTDDEYVLKFENITTSKIVLAAWSLSGFPHVSRLPGGRGCYDVFDLYGNSLEKICEDSRGLHLNLTQSPMYLISK